MNISKAMFSEKIGETYESLKLTPEMEKCLEREVLPLIHACLRDHGRGLAYEPMIQECLITAARAMLRYDGARHGVKVTTYIYSAIENCIRMEKRRLVSLKAKHCRGELSFEGASISYESDYMDDSIEYRDKVNWLDWAEGAPETGLTDEERQVIQLTRKGLSQTEIGKIIGRSQSVVSQRKTSGTQKLSDLWNKMKSEGRVNI